MRGLTVLHRRDEDGAVVVLMAAFSLVMVGMAALVVDVGSLLDEKRQLQNGADAGALAVAHSCALGLCDPNLAGSLADANSRDADSAASVSYPAAKRVLVRTSTSGGGISILPYSFGRALTGVEGKTVQAAATALWGPAGRATVVRLAISQCDVEHLGLDPVDSVIAFHDTSAPCDGSSGDDAPGAFGWLDDDGTGDGCELTVSAGGTAGVDPGASGPTRCLVPYLGKDVLLPVFDDVIGITGTGTNARYTVKGFAMFHLTGYRFGAAHSVPAPCAGSTSCIQGHFIRYLTPSDVIGGADFGVSTVRLVS